MKLGMRSSLSKTQIENVCGECDEQIPPLSRVCPYCLVDDTFSSDIQEFETPIHMLNTMRGCMDEYLASSLPTLLTLDTNLDREAVATFECVRDVVMLTFGKKRDVVDAVSVMEDLLYERMEYRRRLYRRKRIVALSTIIIAVTTLIFSLFVLIY